VQPIYQPSVTEQSLRVCVENQYPQLSPPKPNKSNSFLASLTTQLLALAQQQIIILSFQPSLKEKNTNIIILYLFVSCNYFCSECANERVMAFTFDTSSITKKHRLLNFGLMGIDISLLIMY